MLSLAVSDIVAGALHLIQFINRPNELLINLDSKNSTVETSLEFLNQIKALGDKVSNNIDNTINGKIGVSFTNSKQINLSDTVVKVINDIIKSAQKVQKLGAKLKE